MTEKAPGSRWTVSPPSFTTGLPAPAEFNIGVVYSKGGAKTADFSTGKSGCLSSKKDGAF